MLLEMHCHTREHSPCSRVSAVELVQRVYAKGLQGIVLTDHHYLWAEAELQNLRRAAKVPEHFLILSGQEVQTRDLGDVLVYGAELLLAKGSTLEQIRVLAPTAALVWAHPYRRGHRPTAAELNHPLFDGVEIFNSNHNVRDNSRALQDWHRERFTAIAGTDTHGGSYAGLYPTLFDHPITTVAELAGEIRQGRCRPLLKEIPKSGAKSLVMEVTFGAKGGDEIRERIIIRTLENPTRWRSARRAHGILAELARQGFDGGVYRVPKAIDQDARNRTLIQQGLRGKPLFDKLQGATVDDGRQFLQMAGRWLARLHRCRLRVTPVGEFWEREPGRVANYLERFQTIDHPHAGRAEALGALLLELEAQLVATAEAQFIQGHGDFHPKNILIGQDNLDNRDSLFVAAIDFESSLSLPPAFDVGCFLAQYRNQFYPYPEVRERYPEELFLNAYLEAAPALPADFLAQVSLFRARTNLGIAAYLIKLGLGESEDLWRVLVEAEQALILLVAGRAQVSAAQG